VDRVQLAQDRDKCLAFVSTVVNLLEMSRLPEVLLDSPRALCFIQLSVETRLVSGALTRLCTL
jgi:hypothetical protein